MERIMGPFGQNEAGHRDRGREALTRSAKNDF